MGTSGQQDGPDRGLGGKWGAQVSRNASQKGPNKYTKVITHMLFAKMLADILPSRFVCGICPRSSEPGKFNYIHIFR